MAALLSAEEVREKGLEDNELENMDLDNESGEIKDISRNVQTISTKTWQGPCQWPHFIDGRVEILVRLYHLIHNHVLRITQADKILHSYPVYAGNIFHTESRLWLESICQCLNNDNNNNNNSLLTLLAVLKLNKRCNLQLDTTDLN